MRHGVTFAVLKKQRTCSKECSNFAFNSNCIAILEIISTLRKEISINLLLSSPIVEK